ncbi:adenylate kinase [Emcibacter sp.]|uniref:adenylate kinase n=1 Tax=Emcibacter sp. TaxID=1979954 RepID=UPI003A8CC11C
MDNSIFSELELCCINVVGTSGSGKSTFAARLAERLNIPLIELDRLNWGPNWQATDEKRLLAKLGDELVQEQWVLDGNYTNTIPLKWAHATMVVWLDYSFIRTLWQITKRSWQRAWSGREVWPDTGNVETFGKLFFSRESMILWVFKTYFSNRRKYANLIQSSPYDHLQFVRLRSPKDAERFLETIPLPPHGSVHGGG